MLTVKCIQKFKKNNKIYGYRLQDAQGNIKDIDTDKLKYAIRNNKMAVSNLTLTSDNRLIESKVKNNINKDLYKVCCDVADFVKVLINRKDAYSTAMDTYEDDTLKKLGIGIVFFFDTPEDSGEDQYRVSIELRSFAEEELDSEQLYSSDATNANKIYKSAEYLYAKAPHYNN